MDQMHKNIEQRDEHGHAIQMSKNTENMYPASDVAHAGRAGGGSWVLSVSHQR